MEVFKSEEEKNMLCKLISSNKNDKQAIISRKCCTWKAKAPLNSNAPPHDCAKCKATVGVKKPNRFPARSRQPNTTIHKSGCAHLIAFLRYLGPQTWRWPPHLQSSLHLAQPWPLPGLAMYWPHPELRPPSNLRCEEQGVRDNHWYLWCLTSHRSNALDALAGGSTFRPRFQHTPHYGRHPAKTRPLDPR